MEYGMLYYEIVAETKRFVYIKEDNHYEDKKRRCKKHCHYRPRRPW